MRLKFANKFQLMLLLFFLCFCGGAQSCPKVCKCVGYSGVGGPCYAGVGGPAYRGVGGAAYDGVGGPCYAGVGCLL